MYFDYVIIGKFNLVYGFYWIYYFDGELNREFVNNLDYDGEWLLIPTSKYELFNPEVKSKILLLLGEVDNCYESLLLLRKYFFLLDTDPLAIDCSL